MTQDQCQEEKAEKKIDVNNEMILMRKDIKKAKSQAIQKLNRKARALEKKKTKTEEQSKKNKDRANRFAEEVKILRTERPDTIFKEIFDSEWTEEDFMKRCDVSLKYRAYMRIAVIPFIKKKLAAIKQQIQEYSNDHEEKSAEKCIDKVNLKRPNEKLSKKPDNANDGDIKATDEESCDEEVAEEESCDEDKEVTYTSDEKEKNDELDEKRLSDEDLILFKPKKIKKVKKKHVEENKSDKNCDKNHVQTSSVLEELSNASLDKDQEAKPEQKPKMLLSDIVKDSKNDDVTCFLENIGQGFRDSSDESSEGYEFDSDADDIKEDQISDNEVDQFFLGDDGADKMKEKPKLKIGKPKVESKKFSRRGATSQFVSLSASKKDKTNDDGEKRAVAKNHTTSDQAKKKKKNRPGQRQRQLLSGTGSKNKGADRRNMKRNAKLDEKNFGGGDKKRGKRDDVGGDDEKVHPSWQASQMKKQQCSIQEFQGKRIVFDDSD